mgnify:CR=1 FL=1
MFSADLKKLTALDLLKTFADILDELKERGVVRTRNNPVADYAEWLAAERLELSLEPNSKRGYGAIDKRGRHYQIKSRRLDRPNASRQLGVIRNLNDAAFDSIIAILFNRDFTIKEAYQIPRSIFKRYAKFSEHQNGYILNLRGNVLKAPRVEEITNVLSKKLKKK